MAYICARCSYTTKVKQNIEKHFNRKRICANINDVVLTDDIKQIVLKDKVYHKPTAVIQPTQITNITNNIQNNNNNTYNLNPETIEQLMLKLGRDMPNFIETKFFRRRRQNFLLHKDKEESRETCPKIPDFLEYIMEFLESERENNTFTLFIKQHIMHLHDDDMWQNKPVNAGIKNVMQLLKALILDAYEICLVRQLKHWKTKMDATENLRQYYSFIECFEIKPTFLEERDNDNKLLYNKNEMEYDNEDYSGYEYVEKLQIIWDEVKNTNKDYKKNKTNNELKQMLNHHSIETNRSLIIN